MPDFDVTIVYEGNIETQEWLYYEPVSYTHLYQIPGNGRNRT